jgi:type IV pilus assembly protein PilA
MHDSGPIQRSTRPPSREAGFTLIELLVVILIIGILAAIAIPSFISQSGKAKDTQAKALVRNAATALETYATDHGDYGGATASSLTSVEAAINTTSNTSKPYVSALSTTANAYTITVTQPQTGNTFTITNTAGSVVRSCTGTNGGCAGGSW